VPGCACRDHHRADGLGKTAGRYLAYALRGGSGPPGGLGAWGKPHVSLRHACDAIGLAHDSQRRKLNNRSWACVTHWVTQMPGDSGGHQLGGHPYRRAGARW